MKALARFFMFVFALSTILSCSAVPAFAATPSAPTDSHIDIEVNGSNGITIKPGAYPDLGSNTTDIQQAAAEKVVSKSKLVAQTITSVCAIVCFVMVILNISKLSTSNTMPILRRQAIIGLLWSLISLTLFGGAWVIVTFFWNFLK